MDNTSPPASTNQSADSPAPEALKPMVDGDTEESTNNSVSHSSNTPDNGKKIKRRTYRPSHKATFIGLAVVVAILAVNAVIFAFVIKKQAKTNDLAANGQVAISQSVLNKLGVNRSSVGDLGVGLVIGPNTQFKNKVAVAGDVNISGDVKLNNKLTASEASLTQLQAGKTSLSDLNVNGNGTVSTLNLRNDLIVAGTTRLQGTVTISQLLSVNNNLNVAGNLSIGGTFSAHSLTSTGTLTIGGHVVTGGSTPSVSAGSHIGSNGTVSISGNDAAGTVAVNTGVGASSGIVANISFHTSYSASPHVVITPIGAACVFFIIRSAGGFSIGISGPAVTGYAFDYIVEQ